MLAGHVRSLLLTLISLAVTIAVAPLIGYRPPLTRDGRAHRDAQLLLAIALIWLSVAFGLVAKSVETASNIPMFLILLFLGSGFVPVHSMPAGLRWFAENDPSPRSPTRRAAS